MQKIVVAFDIDGTLRCNCEDDCRNANEEVANTARFLATCKNVKLIAWSGGGADYVRSIVRDMGLDDIFKDSQCFSKLNYQMKYPIVDIAFDDQHATALADKNIIIKAK